jgi:hypothetical protein
MTHLKQHTALLIFGLTLSPVSGLADELHIYEHNGSVIEWRVGGDMVKAVYRAPRPGLQVAGVRPGAVLFEGVYEGDWIVGTAYAFKLGCAPARYEVIGREEDGRILLQGPAPTWSQYGCAISGHSATSPHAKLMLIYSTTHH